MSSILFRLTPKAFRLHVHISKPLYPNKLLAIFFSKSVCNFDYIILGVFLRKELRATTSIFKKVFFLLCPKMKNKSKVNWSNLSFPLQKAT